MLLGQLSRPLKTGVLTWGILLGIVVSFYALTFSFRNITDTDLNSLQTRALTFHGDVDLNRYRGSLLPQRSKSVVHDGKLYSTYGVGVSVTAFPIYATAARLGASDKTLQALSSIPFVAVGALILLALFLRLFPRGIAVGAATVYAFGTTMWPVAAMGFFQTGPASLFQALGLLGLFSGSRRGAVLAGLGFAGGAFIRPTLFIPLFVVGVLYLFEQRAILFAFVIGATPFLAGAAVQNRWIWGSWLSGSYSDHGVGFHADMAHALNGLLFGWWRGLFIYSPVLIVGVAGLWLALRNSKGFMERRLIALGVSSLAMILLYSRWTVWFGGTSQFGYRLLLDIVPFLVVLGAYAVARSPRMQTVAIPLGVLSIMTMTFGAAPNIYGWDAGIVEPKAISQTSLGQAWTNFIHHPGGGVFRLLAVAGIGALFLAFAPARRCASESQGVPVA